MLAIQVFIYLQILDFMTTLLGFRLGASEASPFIVKLIHASTPAIGVGLSKLAGVGIGALCIALNRHRLISWINYWYAGLIVWNLSILMTVLSRANSAPLVH